MNFDDIPSSSAESGAVISKLFCARARARGNCYGNFNGRTAGVSRAHAESCRRFEIVRERLQRVPGAREEAAAIIEQRRSSPTAEKPGARPKSQDPSGMTWIESFNYPRTRRPREPFGTNLTSGTVVGKFSRRDIKNIPRVVSSVV